MRYIVLLLSMTLLILSKYKNKYKKFFIFSSATVLILFASFRGIIAGGVYKGNDFESYRKWFELINTIKISWDSEALFNYLLMYIYKYTNSFFVFICITSVLLVYSIYKFSFENSSNYLYTIFCFIAFGIYELAFSAIRQWIAGAIFLIAFKFIKEREFWKYFICIMIASAFHNSAIVLLVIYPFINIRIDVKIKIIAVIFLSAIITLLTKSSAIIELIYNYFPAYRLKYINIGNELNSNYTVFIISAVCLFITQYYKKAFRNKDEGYNYKTCYLVLLFFFSYIATLNPMFGRLLQYFMPAIPLIMPSIISLVNKKEQRLFVLSASTVFFCLIFIF